MDGEPPFHDGVRERFNAAALDLSDALVPDFVGSDFRRGVAKHERRDALRALTIKLLRDEAADGQSDNRGASDAENVQERREVARIIGDVVVVRAGFGKPVAALVVGDDAEIRREDFGDLIPDAEVGAQGIDEDERRPVAPALVENSG